VFNIAPNDISQLELKQQYTFLNMWYVAALSSGFTDQHWQNITPIAIVSVFVTDWMYRLLKTDAAIELCPCHFGL